MRYRTCLAATAVVAGLFTSALATTIGTATVTNATHYGYYGFASTSAQNTKANLGPFSGTARVIHIAGTVTRVNSEAWLSSIQVQPSGNNLAVYQPWIQFSEQRDFTGTVNVATDVFIPGGLNLSQQLHLEMFSLDSESFVPGVDARSTLTYTFDNAFAPGTAEYSGALTTTDPTFNRPAQYQYANGFGQVFYSAPELTGAHPYYDVQPFTVATAGAYSMVSANEFESASALYAGNFDPNNPLANCVMARNQSGNVLRNKSLNNLAYLDDAVGATMLQTTLQPGVQYYFVTTAFNFPGIEPDGGPFVGRYNNVITGAGAVTLGLIPEPATALTSLGVLMAAKRRRNAGE